jgi:hypothetical protein
MFSRTRTRTRTRASWNKIISIKNIIRVHVQAYFFEKKLLTTRQICNDIYYFKQVYLDEYTIFFNEKTWEKLQFSWTTPGCGFHVQKCKIQIFNI